MRKRGATTASRVARSSDVSRCARPSDASHSARSIAAPRPARPIRTSRAATSPAAMRLARTIDAMRSAKTGPAPAPPCYYAQLCARRAEIEMSGRSVCRACAAKNLRGREYPLRAPTPKPLYANDRAAAEALDIYDPPLDTPSPAARAATPPPVDVAIELHRRRTIQAAPAGRWSAAAATGN
jgi:hypothetical protein